MLSNNLRLLCKETHLPRRNGELGPAIEAAASEGDHQNEQVAITTLHSGMIRHGMSMCRGEQTETQKRRARVVSAGVGERTQWPERSADAEARQRRCRNQRGQGRGVEGMTRPERRSSERCEPAVSAGRTEQLIINRFREQSEIAAPLLLFRLP
jgi:hypothetical protein